MDQPGRVVNDINGYLASSSARSQWVAVWVLWMEWALLWIAHQIHHTYVGDGTDGTTVEATTTTTTTTAGRRAVVNMGSRLERAQRLSRDLFLWLFFAIVVNSFGRGSTTANTTLSWIYLALGTVWIVCAMALHLPGVVRGLVGIVQFALILAILSLGYVYGWNLYTL